MPSDVTSRSLRLMSRSAVLRKLLVDREATRAILSASANVSAGTVSNVLVDLKQERLVHETGVLPSDGGRPTTLVSLRPDGAFFAGANVGERTVIVEIFDLQLSRRATATVETPKRGATAEEIRDTLQTALRSALSKAGEPELSGIGLGLPGIVAFEGDDARGGRGTLYAQTLGWSPMSVDSLLDVPGVPVFADNAAKTLANAERWFGAAAGVRDAAVALFGRGIGLGVINDGEMFQAAGASAAEWGHTKVILGGGPLCNCGARGCLEAFIGEIGIARRWREAGGAPSDNEESAFSELLQAVTATDPIAESVLNETLDIMGLGLANLVNVFAPRRIVIGGWVGMQLSSTHMSRIELAARANALAWPGSQFELVKAQLSGDAVALGAALLPVENLIAEPKSADEVRAH